MSGWLNSKHLWPSVMVALVALTFALLAHAFGDRRPETDSLVASAGDPAARTVPAGAEV